MKKKTIDFLLYGNFIFYVVLLLTITIFKYVSPIGLFDNDREFYRSVNLIPFKTISEYISGSVDVSKSIIWDNILGNLCLFIPFGIYLLHFYKNHKAIHYIIMIVLTSIAIELIQYILSLGATDIDDVILNSLGGVIGVLLYRMIDALMKDKQKVKSLLAICSSFIGIPLFFICILLFLNN